MSRNVAETVEDLEFLDDTNVGAAEAARRTDFASPEAMEKWLERNGRYDLWRAMKARDPEGMHSQKARRSTTVDTPQNDSIASLLAEADQSSKARIRNKADRVRSLVAELRESLTAEREDAVLKERARKDVARLERELAKAKALLRGGSTSVDVGSGVSAADLRAWARRNGVECPPRGRVPSHVRDAYEASEGEAS